MLNNNLIKTVLKENIKISNNEIQNQFSIIFEDLNQSDNFKTITLKGKGFLKTLTKV